MKTDTFPKVITEYNILRRPMITIKDTNVSAAKM